MLVEEIDYARLTAYIDGEGTIAIAKQPVKKGRVSNSYRLLMMVSNTEKKLPNWCKAHFGGSVHTSRNDVRPGRKKLYQWVIGTHDSAKLLEKIKPYLIIKRDQAELGLEFYEKCIKRHPSGKRVPLWLAKQREEYFERMKELHE
ncbi:MAG: hypothetical protein WBC40_01080 [Halobacteriota archaeon]